MMNKGVFPTMVTPFDAEGNIDYESLDRFIEKFKADGADGLFAVCQSSEMFDLSMDEKTKLAAYVKKNSDMQVIASGHTQKTLREQVDSMKKMADTGVDMVSNGDSPAGPDMISEDMYERFALPYERIIAEEAHKQEKPYMLHICGNTDIILDKMIDTGVDALELDYKTNIYKVQEICYKGKVTFSGNVDPSGVLAFGNTRLVEEKTKEVLTIFKDNPGLIINAVHGEELYTACLDEPMNSLNHTKIFIVVKPATLGWKNEHRFAVIPINF